MSLLNDYPADENQILSSIETASDDIMIRRNCGSRWKHELFNKGYGFFDMEESGLGSKRLIDVERCFAPSRKFFATELARLTMFIFTVVMYFVNMYRKVYDNRRYMYFVYLTNWTLTFTIVYQLLILLISTRPGRSILARHNPTDPGYIVKIIWLLYSFMLPMNILVVSMFWMLEYPTKEQKAVNINMVFPHAISCIFVILDGFVISTIPLRMKQVIFNMIYALVYTAFTLIHGLVIKNGDGINKDLPLYSVVDWDKKPIGTLITICMIVFIGVPLIFTILWTLSLWSKCCKFDGSHRPTITHQEEDSKTDVNPLYGSAAV